MQLRASTVTLLLCAAFLAGCEPAAGCGTPAAQPPPTPPLQSTAQPHLVGYQIENQQRPPKPKPDRKKNTCTKSNSPQWKNLEPYRGDIKTNGESGKDRRFYTWDHTHDEIEVWDRRGDHLGSIDPATGETIKSARSDRTIRDKI